VNKPELLAPAGGPENFFAAIEAGADAVYMGLPGVNARNLAREPSLAEIGAMIEYARARGKKIYLAANSLIFQKEIKPLLHTLAALSELAPDALIAQDLGLLHLIREYFPNLTRHASTLMTAHNSAAVTMLARLGCKRVVLARELTLQEIAAITAQARRDQVEIEVFIHGAMCFAYSGLCLFSSYLGGKSGLRGQCVQPCRRAYQIGDGAGAGQKNRGGYLFSMNDLAGPTAIGPLREAGVAALKIEGRQRSARYVATVVAAYRRVLDAEPARFEEEMAQAQEMLDAALTRKTTDGYFFSPQPNKAITPWHSGNLGRYLGRITAARDRKNGQSPLPPLKLAAPLSLGCRLRLHLEPSGERLAFTLKELRWAGREVTEAANGDEVLLNPPDPKRVLQSGWRSIDCYLVDAATEMKALPPLSTKAVAQKLRLGEQATRAWLDDLARRLAPLQATSDGQETPGARPARKPTNRGKTLALPLPFWLRVDAPEMLKQPLPHAPEAIVFGLNQRMMRQLADLARRYGGERLIAALPPIIFDHERGRYEGHLKQLRRLGIARLQLGHIGQLAMFDLSRLRLLAADYTLNLANALALRQAASLGIAALQFAIELDKSNLFQAIDGFKRGDTGKTVRLGLTVYGWPALFTSRLSAPFFAVEKSIVSPKHELFRHQRDEAGSRILPRRPFSLLPHLAELATSGLDYVVIDMRGATNARHDMEELARRLGPGKNPGKLPSFNYAGVVP
jgi:putative protease